MITRDDKLEVLESFREDPSLPKFARARQQDEDESRQGTIHWTTKGQVMVATSFNRNPIGTPKAFLLSWHLRLWQWILDLLFRAKSARLMTVEAFFRSVHNAESELVVVDHRAAGYERAILKAKQSGQRALLERLEKGLNAYRMETQLLAMGLPKYVEEKDIVRFYKQSKRGLRLDWIANFTRQIPDAVLEDKQRADELGIFDNYVILHYDPKAKSYAETQAETRARKDPILFGLVDGSRRLYCVGDWIDEFCDLTLDQVADAVGKDVVKNIQDPE